MRLIIGLSWIFTKIRNTLVLFTHPKQVFPFTVGKISRTLLISLIFRRRIPNCVKVQFNKTQTSKVYALIKILVLYQSNRMFLDLTSTLAGALKYPHKSWKPGCRAWKVVALAIAIRRGGVFLVCVWSARSRLWVLLYAALMLLGFLSEPQQI